MKGKYKMLDKMITDCFVIIDGYFTAEQAVEFINNWGRHPEFYHFGLGTRIRNELLLPGSALYLEFCRHGVFSADDMSSYVITMYYRHLVKQKLRRKWLSPDC